MGDLWFARGDYTRAREFADRCLDIATRTNSRKNLVKGLRLKGEIAIAQHQLDDAELAFRRALTIAETIGNPTQLWKTCIAGGRLKRQLKEADEAQALYEKAIEVVNRVRANLGNQRLRASFERSPIFRSLYDVNEALE